MEAFLGNPSAAAAKAVVDDWRDAGVVAIPDAVVDALFAAASTRARTVPSDPSRTLAGLAVNTRDRETSSMTARGCVSRPGWFEDDADGGSQNLGSGAATAWLTHLALAADAAWGADQGADAREGPRARLLERLDGVVAAACAFASDPGAERRDDAVAAFGAAPFANLRDSNDATGDGSILADSVVSASAAIYRAAAAAAWSAELRRAVGGFRSADATRAVTAEAILRGLPGPVGEHDHRASSNPGVGVRVARAAVTAVAVVAAAAGAWPAAFGLAREDDTRAGIATGGAAEISAGASEAAAFRGLLRALAAVEPGRGVGEGTDDPGGGRDAWAALRAAVQGDTVAAPAGRGDHPRRPDHPSPGAEITPGDWNAALDAFADATIRIDGRDVSFDVPPGADPDADAAPSTSAVAAAAAAGAYLGAEKLATRVERGNALEKLARAAEDFLAAPLTATARKKTMDARREVAARVAAGTRLVGAAVAGARSLSRGKVGGTQNVDSVVVFESFARIVRAASRGLRNALERAAEGSKTAGTDAGAAGNVGAAAAAAARDAGVDLSGAGAEWAEAVAEVRARGAHLAEAGDEAGATGDVRVRRGRKRKANGVADAPAWDGEMPVGVVVEEL